MPFCNVHFRYPSIIGISHCTLLTHELSTLVKFYITKPLTLFPRRYPLSSTTHDLLRWNQQLLQDQCKWPPINSLCETRRRVAAICPFNGNCDIPSTCFRVSVCVFVHASITHALRASHARSYRPSRVSNVRLQFHLLLRHAFPWLFAFPAYYSFRFIFLYASSVRCRRYFTTNRINIVYLHVYSSFLPLSILSSWFINSRMIWIIGRHTFWDYTVTYFNVLSLTSAMTGKLDLRYYIYYVTIVHRSLCKITGFIDRVGQRMTQGN